MINHILLPCIYTCIVTKLNLILHWIFHHLLLSHPCLRDDLNASWLTLMSFVRRRTEAGSCATNPRSLRFGVTSDLLKSAVLIENMRVAQQTWKGSTVWLRLTPRPPPLPQIISPQNKNKPSISKTDNIWTSFPFKQRRKKFSLTSLVRWETRCGFNGFASYQTNHAV